jgi:5'-nucleotidase
MYTVILIHFRGSSSAIWCSSRSPLIETIRKEKPNVLLLDAGDIFRNLYFNYYGGELEFKLMSMMQYDASTIGNHDFDNGVEGLYTTTAC